MEEIKNIYLYLYVLTTDSSFQKDMTFCRSIYVKKVMKLVSFIFEQPSYYFGVTVTLTPDFGLIKSCVEHISYTI